MKVDDYALGRLMRSYITNFAAPTTGLVIAPANNQRVALNVALTAANPSGTAIVDVLCGGLLVFHLSSVINFVHIDMDQYGDMLTKQFTVSVTNFTGTVAVIETVVPEEFLAACSCKFKQDYSQWLAQR